MRVKDLAALAGTTVRTVRYYHQLGLLDVPDEGASWRSYGFAHLTRLMRIRWLVESGVPLAEVPHMLRPPGSADERTVVQEDLVAVLASMDGRLAALTEQRAAVAALLDRVTTRGRLSPLPDGVVRMYAALLDRPLPEPVRAAITRERDLLELVSYRYAVPDDIEHLVAAFSDADLDELCEVWEQVHRIDLKTRQGLDPASRDLLDGVLARVIDLAVRVEPTATAHLLAMAGELDRPAVRAAVDLAYSTPAYRYFIHQFVARATVTSTR